MALTTAAMPSTNLALLGSSCLPTTSCCFELAIPISEDLLVAANHLVRRSYIANCTVQPHLVVVPDIAVNKANCILHREWCPRTDALRLDRTMPTLDLAVALGIIRRCSHMCHTADSDELLEVSSDELRTVVADNPGRNSRIALESSLGNRFNVAFFHLWANLPMHNRSATAVKQVAKEEERPPHVDVGDVDVPVLMQAAAGTRSP